MKKSFIAASALATVLSGSLVFAQSQNDQLEKVKAIMEQSHQIQQQKRNDAALQEDEAKARTNFFDSLMKSSTTNAKQEFVSQGGQSTNSVSSKPAVATTAVVPKIVPSSVDAETTKELESQLSQINQANVLFQQQTDQRIDVLNQEHTVLQNKLARLGEVLGMLNQEVTQLNQQIQSAQKQILSTSSPAQQQASEVSGFHSFADKVEGMSSTQYVLYAILVLLIVVILLLISRRNQPVMQTVSAAPLGDSVDSGDIDTKDEYDFMGSDEAIPAKLDLARAYLAMEDYKSARKVLTQVVQKGTKEQRAEAKAMLDRIPSSEAES